MRVVITGGGTAGHVFPAISVGNYMRQELGVELFYIGNEHFIESKLAMENAIEFHSISSQGLEGKNKFDKYGKFAINNTKGVVQAIKLLRKIKPDFVFGTGGFVSAPVLTAAILLKIPFAIHEQNSVMGKVNGLFKDKAKHVFYSFPRIEEGNSKYTGCPVRFNERLEENGDKMLFVGGSGGSKSINQSALHFAVNNPEVPCILITGKGLYAEVKKDAEKRGIQNMEIVNYADDMMHYYKQAKMVVCRSGAGTIFEIANLNIPMILVPLPTSAENHQLKNAQHFSSKNAAILIEEKEDMQEELNEKAMSLYQSEEQIYKMKKNLEKLSKTDTAEVIAKQITSVMLQESK